MLKRLLICLTSFLLDIVLLNTCYGENNLPEVDITLVSYDFFTRNPDNTSVWLRFKTEYNTEQFQIDEIGLNYHGPHEEDVMRSVMLPQSDPAIYEFLFGNMLIEKPVDDDYVREMITAGYLKAQIALRNKKTDELLFCSCEVDCENVIMGTDFDSEAYRIEVNKFEYRLIAEPSCFFQFYPGLKEYVESHPGIACYRIALIGKEDIYAAGKAILDPRFFSLSDYLFLDEKGGIYETSADASDEYDLLLEGRKNICFHGIICAENSDSIQNRINNAEMFIAFSTEYAGTFDLFDAGDRFNGPRGKALPIIISETLMKGK